MSIIDKSEWSKLHLAKYKDWTISLGGDQHVLGWLIIFPPVKIEASLVHLDDKELLEFKEVGLICEKLLQSAFQSKWFNYSQAGNVTKRLHIHLIPRYSEEREFEGRIFTDESWGHPVKYLDSKDLPNKDVVLKMVEYLKETLEKLDIPEVETVK